MATDTPKAGPARVPFADIDGLTDEERAFLDREMRRATGGLEPVDAERGGRTYLPCGHQMGGPFDPGPRTCGTCLDWLAEHPHAHDHVALAAATATPTPPPAPARPSAIQWLMLAALIVMVLTVAVDYGVTGDAPAGFVPIVAAFYVLYIFNRRRRP